MRCSSPLPKEAGGLLRVLAYRRIGIRIGKGTYIGKGWHIEGMGKPYGRLTIGERCFLRGVRFELNCPVTVGDRVSISDGVLISTDGHEIGPSEQRMGHIRSRPMIHRRRRLDPAQLHGPGRERRRGRDSRQRRRRDEGRPAEHVRRRHPGAHRPRASGRGRTRASRRGGGAVSNWLPILTYHRICDVPRADDPLQLCTRPRDLERVLRYLTSASLPLRVV